MHPAAPAISALASTLGINPAQRPLQRPVARFDEVLSQCQTDIAYAQLALSQAVEGLLKAAISSTQAQNLAQSEADHLALRQIHADFERLHHIFAGDQGLLSFQLSDWLGLASKIEMR